MSVCNLNATYENENVILRKCNTRPGRVLIGTRRKKCIFYIISIKNEVIEHRNMFTYLVFHYLYIFFALFLLNCALYDFLFTFEQIFALHTDLEETKKTPHTVYKLKLQWPLVAT